MKTWMRKLVVVGICLLGAVNCAKDKDEMIGTGPGFRGMPVSLNCQNGVSLYSVYFDLTRSNQTASVTEFNFMGPPAALQCIDMVSGVPGSDIILQCDDYNILVELRGSVKNNYYYANIWDISTGYYQTIAQGMQCR